MKCLAKLALPEHITAGCQATPSAQGSIHDIVFDLGKTLACGGTDHAQPGEGRAERADRRSGAGGDDPGGETGVPVSAGNVIEENRGNPTSAMRDAEAAALKRCLELRDDPVAEQRLDKKVGSSSQ